MNALSEYIIEKLHLTKDSTKDSFKNAHNNMSFDSWAKYLKEHGLRLFQYNINGGVYGICLEKSKYWITDPKGKIRVNELSTPYVDIESVNDEYFLFYSYAADGGIQVNINSKNDNEVRNVELEELDTNVDKKKAIKDHTSWGYTFTKNNVDYIFDILTQMYDISK